MIMIQENIHNQRFWPIKDFLQQQRVVKKELHKILDNLATYGIGEPGLFAGYSECKEGFIETFRIVDVRTLVDGENPLFEYELNIIRVVSYLELGEKAVICCRAGVSRSNAIALGVLAYYFKIDFNKALELITAKVPICNILLPHISAICRLLNVQDRSYVSHRSSNWIFIPVKRT